MADPLTDLVTTLMHAIGALGSDRDEQDLHRMAIACRRCANDLDTMGEQIDSAVRKGQDNWSGDAAEHFQAMRDTYFNPAERVRVITSLRHVADVLDQARTASHQTKRALEELIKSIATAVAASVAISMAAGLLGKYVAWAQRVKIANQAEIYAVPILARMKFLLQRVVEPLRRVATLVGKSDPGLVLFKPATITLKKNKVRQLAATLGNSRLASALTLNGSAGWSFGRTSLQTMKDYWKVFGLSYTGNYVSSGLARTLNGQSFIMPFGLGYAQLTNASWVAGALPFGTTWWSNLARAHPARMNFAAGFAAGSIPSVMNDMLEGKPLSQIAKNVATFGLVAGGFNAGMGGLFKQVGIRDPKMVMGIGSFFGLAPGIALRAAPVIGVPLAPAPAPLKIDNSAIGPFNTSAPQPHPPAPPTITTPPTTPPPTHTPAPPTPSRTAAPSPTPSPTTSPSPTPTPSPSPNPTPTPTATTSPSPTPTLTPTATTSPSPSATTAQPSPSTSADEQT